MVDTQQRNTDPEAHPVLHNPSYPLASVATRITLRLAHRTQSLKLRLNPDDLITMCSFDPKEAKLADSARFPYWTCPMPDLSFNYDHSRPFDVWKWSDYPEVNRVVNQYGKLEPISSLSEVINTQRWSVLELSKWN